MGQLDTGIYVKEQNIKATQPELQDPLYWKVVEAEEGVQSSFTQTDKEQHANKSQKIVNEKEWPILLSHEIRQSQDNISTNVASRPPIPLVFAKQTNIKSNKAKATNMSREEAKVNDCEEVQEFVKRRKSVEKVEEVNVGAHSHIEMQDNHVLEEVLLRRRCSITEEGVPKECKEGTKLTRKISLQSMSVGESVKSEESSRMQNRQMSINKSMQTKSVLPQSNISKNFSIISTGEEIRCLGVTDHKEREAKLSKHTASQKKRGESIVHQEGLHIREDKMHNLVVDEEIDQEKAKIRYDDNQVLMTTEHGDIRSTTDLDQSNTHHEKHASSNTHRNVSKKSASKNSIIQGQDQSNAEVVENMGIQSNTQKLGRLSFLSKESSTVTSQDTLEGLAPLVSSKISERDVVDSETVTENCRRNFENQSRTMGQNISQERASDLATLPSCNPSATSQFAQAEIRNKNDQDMQRIINVGMVIGFKPDMEKLKSETAPEIESSI